ncbi:MAG TPA: hypothetical protein PKE12_14585 [Kiritimatiellia bacterium]|nr:hypothetical protein [Kiritimatiellia bacterium]
MPVGIMIAYARSGGTLLARCLASLPGTMLFSEVNPRRRTRVKGRLATLESQARAWHGLELRSEDFGGQVRELEAHARVGGRYVILRDWPVIDFVPIKENDHQASGRFSIMDAVADVPDARAFGFVRDAYDVWVSNGCHDDFFTHYRPYLEALFRSGIPIFRYEDLCADPDAFMRKLCAHLDIPFCGEFRNFARFTNVTGDIELPGGSRGSSRARIVQLPRPRISRDKVAWLETQPDAKAVNELAGYPTAYAARRLENRWMALVSRWSRHIRPRRRPHADRV